MGIGKRMLKAAIPERELPGWFEVESVSSDTKTTLTLSAKVDGKTVTTERVLDKDSATIMDLVALFPDVESKIPRVARKALEFLPVPRKCKVSGMPVPDQDTPTKQVARLQFDARVWGKDVSYHYDSTMDKLYMADLVEMLDWVKAVQRQHDEAEAQAQAAGKATQQ